MKHVQASALNLYKLCTPNSHKYLAMVSASIMISTNRSFHPSSLYPRLIKYRYSIEYTRIILYFSNLVRVNKTFRKTFRYRNLNGCFFFSKANTNSYNHKQWKKKTKKRQLDHPFYRVFFCYPCPFFSLLQSCIGLMTQYFSKLFSALLCLDSFFFLGKLFPT